MKGVRRPCGLVIWGTLSMMLCGFFVTHLAIASELKCMPNDRLPEADARRLRSALARVTSEKIIVDDHQSFCIGRGMARAVISTAALNNADGSKGFWAIVCNRATWKWECDTPEKHSVFEFSEKMQGLDRRITVRFTGAVTIDRAKVLAREVLSRRMRGEPPPVDCQALRPTLPYRWDELSTQLKEQENITVDVSTDGLGRTVVNANDDAITFRVQDSGANDTGSDQFCWEILISVS